MKIVLVGDLFIPSQTCIAELDTIVEQYGASYHVLDWEAKDLEELNKRNIHVEKVGPAAERPPEKLWNLIKDVNILIVHFCPISEALLKRAAYLKVIGTMRTGLSNINTVVAKRLGVDVINLPGRLGDSVSEYTIGLMIAETRNIARSYEAIRKGNWVKKYSNDSFCYELSGKTVGIIGFGEVGKKVVDKLRGFNVRIIAYDPYIQYEIMSSRGVEKVELDYLLAKSDIISIHTKLDDTTRGMIGKREITLMKPTSYIINTARADIIDKNSLYYALSRKLIAGAAIDVFWTEPVDASDPLLHLENVTVTSHLAGTTKDALLKSLSKLNKKLKPYYEKLSQVHTHQ